MTKEAVYIGVDVAKDTLDVGVRRNPIIAAFYRRMLDAGKVKKVALVACMRKLLTMVNAMIRAGKVWNLEPIRNITTEV